MANNLDSNITRRLVRIFLEKFESNRVLTKTVNTQLLGGKFNPSTGSIIDFKRPHDYNSIRTAGGDITGIDKSDIISGKASGVVQDYFTVATEWGNVEEALELDQLDQILAPMATRIVTDLELDLAQFMYANLGLVAGDAGEPVDAWGDVANAGALMKSLGIPSDGGWNYVMNPFVTTALADTQSGLSSGNNSLVNTAWERAQISTRFGGLRAMTSNALGTLTAGTSAARTGTVGVAPAGTYLAAKDTMQMSVGLSGLTATTGTVAAGEVIEFTDSNYLNLSTRRVIIGVDGNPVTFKGVIVTGGTADGSGDLQVVVAGAAINETDGQYNTTDNPIEVGDAFTLGMAANAISQPSLFYHQQAIGLGTVKLPKLYSTDTVATTEDGFSIRCSKYSDGDANQQKIRFDLLPAFACFNPFFGGKGFGITTP